MKLKTLATLGILALGMVVMSGCPKQVRAVHPNAINQFDSDAFDTLLTAQAAIEQAKIEEPKFPQAKGVLNQAIFSYNTAVSAYMVYHSAGAVNTAELQISLRNLAAALVQMQSAFGLKAGGKR